MGDHKSFCDWLLRNHDSLSIEAWEAGERVARWLFVMESGEALPDVAERAASDLKKFRELVGR